MAGAIKSTGKKDYTTPEYLLEPTRAFFGELFPKYSQHPIGLDPCSNPKSTVQARLNVMLEDPPALEAGSRRDGFQPVHYLKGDGLAMGWVGHLTQFMNPPFGYDKTTKIGIKNWILNALAEDARARAAATSFHQILCLPDTPETLPWKNGVLLRATGRCQLAKRVKFGGMKTGIPKPISMVYLGPEPELFKEHFKYFGRVENPRETYADQAGMLL